jgi:hypothetical protein
MTEAGGTKAGASIGLGAPAFLAGADLGQRGGSGAWAGKRPATGGGVTGRRRRRKRASGGETGRRRGSGPGSSGPGLGHPGRPLKRAVRRPKPAHPSLLGKSYGPGGPRPGRPRTTPRLPPGSAPPTPHCVAP